MTHNCFELITLSSVISNIIYTTCEYPKLPDSIAMHFNIYGDADSYNHKRLIFIFPLIMSILFIIFYILPKRDPNKENVDKFHFEMTMFEATIQLFFTYVTYLVISYNTQKPFDMIYWIIPGLSVLMLVTGHATEKSKRNRFFGVRTSWAMKNDENWEIVNKLGGLVLKLVGIQTAFGFILTKWIICASFIELFVGLIAIYIYSYTANKKEKNSSE